MAIGNRTLGRFHLDGIPPAPRGMPQIEVTFDIDANGILNVAAKDKATAREQSIRIEASTGLSKEEIEKMVNDAKSHASEDKKKRELADIKNQADQVAYQTEKNIKELGDKIDSTSKGKLEAAVGRVREALKTDNVDEIKSSLDALNQIWNEVSATLYQQQQAAGGAGPQQGPPPGAETETKDEKEVEEADYEVVDDEKK